MEADVLLDGKVVGKLTPARTEQKDIPLELASPSAGLKPRVSHEEVVTRLEGQIDLPAGTQQILLVPRNIVDGKLNAIGVGIKPSVPANLLTTCPPMTQQYQNRLRRFSMFSRSIFSRQSMFILLVLVATCDFAARQSVADVPGASSTS